MLDNKDSLKHYENTPKQLKTASTNSLWAYIQEGLLWEGFFASDIWGAHFREGLFLGGGGAYFWNFTVDFNLFSTI